MIENFISEILSGNLTRLKAEKIAKQNGLTDIVKVKELVEYACLLAYRSITSNQNLNFQQKFDEIKKIYQTQPNLSVRSTRSMELAQYSTAAPIAFLAGAYVAAKLPPDFRILEPSAGNGMMSIFWGHNTQNIWVNEIDQNRIENLRKSNFLMISNHDANEIDQKVNLKFDGIITNPPFGSTRQTIDTYKIIGLEHAMAMKALKLMTYDGRAAIIVGGHSEYTGDKIIDNKNRVFLNYLYHFYNVDDVVNINGDLYSKMGTSFDIRLILINGRKQKPNGFNPNITQQNQHLKQTAQTFDELKDRVEKYIHLHYKANKYEQSSELTEIWKIRKQVAIDNAQADLIFSKTYPKWISDNVTFKVTEKRTGKEYDNYTIIKATPAGINYYGTIAHKKIVEKALSENKPVPAEVLQDYPELKKQNVDNYTENKEINEYKIKPIDTQIKLFNNENIAPIRQLGTGANVYFETNHLRLNDSYDYSDKKNKGFLLIITKPNSTWTTYRNFDKLESGYYTAKLINHRYPNGFENMDSFEIERKIDLLKLSFNQINDNQIFTQQIKAKQKDINSLNEIYQNNFDYWIWKKHTILENVVNNKIDNYNEDEEIFEKVDGEKIKLIFDGDFFIYLEKDDDYSPTKKTYRVIEAKTAFPVVNNSVSKNKAIIEANKQLEKNGNEVLTELIIKRINEKGLSPRYSTEKTILQNPKAKKEISNDNKNLTVPVLRYKNDGNTLTNTKLEIEKLPNFNNVYISVNPVYKENKNSSSNDYYFAIAKITRNDKTVYYSLYQSSKDTILHKSKEIENIIETSDFSEPVEMGQFYNSLFIEVARQLGYPTEKFELSRKIYKENYEKQEEQKRIDRQIKEQNEELQRQEQRKSDLEQLAKHFLAGEFVDASDLVDLAKIHNINVHIRTIGSLRARNVKVKINESFDEYEYNYSRKKGQAKFKFNGSFIFQLAEKLKDIQPEKPQITIEMKIRIAKAKAIALKLKTQQLDGVKDRSEYILAVKVQKELEKRGIQKNFSVSEGYGLSIYFTVWDGENLNKPKLKVRISDHSVSNYDRIFNEHHFNFKSDYLEIANLIELAIFPERYDKIEVGIKYYSKYDNYVVNEVDENGFGWTSDIEEMNETSLKKIREHKGYKIISEKYLRKSKTGNNVYEVELKKRHEVNSVPVYKYVRKEQLDGVYVPAADNCNIIDTIIPDNQDSEQRIAIRKIREEVGGSLTNYVSEKLKITPAKVCEYFYGEQVDAIANAIYKMEKNRSLIIGDMTGIGKGRCAAAIVKYAILNKFKPIFVTEKPTLFTDFYRDMNDIGAGEYKPFIVNGRGKKTNVLDANGNLVYQPPKRSDQQQIFENRNLKGYDYIMATYSQFTQPKKYPTKVNFIYKVGEKNILILDEAHNAAGSSTAKKKGGEVSVSSATSQVFMTLVEKCKGVVYLSATYAKRPNNMPIYTLKSCLSEANMTHQQLTDAVAAGGPALQEIISAQLVQQGEMIRREKSYEGIEVKYLPLANQAEEHKVTSDNITEIVREIIDFQKNYIQPILDDMDKTGSFGEDEQVEADEFDLLEEEENEVEETMNGLGSGTLVQAKKGTKEAGISNTDYFSKVFNLIKQMLFSIKAEAVANLTVSQLREGKKPIIAFASTMESFFNEMKRDDGTPAQIGDMVKSDFKEVLVRGVYSVMKYTVKTANGDNEHYVLNPEKLPNYAKAKYDEIIEKISNASTSISLSPIDVLIHIIKKAGFRVAEITGRKRVLEYVGNDFTKAYYRNRTENLPANEAFRLYNDNEIDCLLINRSGSTGASGQAKPTAKVPESQLKQRWMNILEAELDINVEVQKRGRINRTGQKLLPGYTYVFSSIPAEQRQMMVLKKKLSSLDANTKSNKDESGNAIIESEDFLNEVGDKVVYEYLMENLKLNDILGDPLKIGKTEESEKGKDKKEFIPENFALKVTGRVAILPFEMQKKFYDDILELYTDRKQYLKDMDEWFIDTTREELKAETIEKKIHEVGSGGQSAFGTDTYMVKAMCNVTKKPFKKVDVENQIKSYLKGKQPHEIQKKLSQDFSKYIDEKIEKNTAELLELKRNKLLGIVFEKNFLKLEDTESRNEYIKYKTELIEKEISEKIERNRNMQQAFKLKYLSLFEFFAPSRPCLYPTNNGNTRAIFIGYDINEKADNPFAASKIRMKFAIANSLKLITLNTAKEQYQKISEIENTTRYFVNNKLNGLGSAVEFIERPDGIFVVSPYDDEFVSFARIHRDNSMAQWIGSGGWRFDLSLKEEVKEKLRTVYGETGIPEIDASIEKVDVKVFLTEPIENNYSVFRIYNAISNYKWREYSEPKFNPNVEFFGTFTKKKMGRKKQWELIPTAGSYIIVKDVALPIVENEKNAKFEIIGDKFADFNEKNKYQSNFGNLSDTLERWDEFCKEYTADRKIRYLVTGNILQAFKHFKGKGKLVTYTTIDGLEDKAILLPDDYDPDFNNPIEKKNYIRIPIQKCLRVIKNTPQGTSRLLDNDFRLAKKYNSENYELILQKDKVSKQISNDEEILKLLSDEYNKFIIRNGEPRADVSDENIEKLIQILGEKYALNLLLPEAQTDHYQELLESKSQYTQNSGDERIKYEKQYQEELTLFNTKKASKPIEKPKTKPNIEIKIRIAKAKAIAIKLKIKAMNL